LEESEHKLQLERRLAQTDKLATIGTLASGFAHEIGTPLGIIRGRTELLMTGRNSDRKLADGLQLILGQIDRISAMVRMLLDLGRRRESVRIPVDLRTVIANSVRLLENEAARRTVEVNCELGSIPLMVDCDPDQLQQVFVNLEINALDAMGHGGQLHITGAYDLPTEKVHLRFTDTGPGIPEQLKERIFDPFFTTKEPGKGTGMGLAVSRSIVGDHDGELTVEPSPLGACFSVVLPAFHASQLKRVA
jgi:signal transduction histidine kinase